jgi:branched-chain amino acid transport system substrate-binding protein
MRSILAPFFVVLLLAGCAEKDAITLGFIGPTTGRSADLGIAGRNGFLLAIEEVNAAGGINGKAVKFTLQDDRTDPEQAIVATQALIDAEVDAIMGPFTSVIAMTIKELVDSEEMLTMAATVTTNDISGLDDYLFRTISPTAHHARLHAEYHATKLGFTNPVLLIDLGNESYTRSWAQDYSESFAEATGVVPRLKTFRSSTDVDFSALVEQVFEESAPDLAVFVSNAVDAAALARAFRLKDENLQFTCSEWAGTERLVSLGGRYVEGMLVPQYLDRDDQSTDYQAFLDAYDQRFSNQSPGFAGKITYNGTKILLRAFSEQQKGESVKQALLRIKAFEALQGDVTFDEFGDTRSKTFITEIVGGQFKLKDKL